MDSENFWRRDKSGVWHWQGQTALGSRGVHEAAEICLDTRPAREPVDADELLNVFSHVLPACFWWQDSFCPIELGDNVARLVDRWREWRDACHRSSALLDRLVAWSRS